MGHVLEQGIPPLILQFVLQHRPMTTVLQSAARHALVEREVEVTILMQRQLTSYFMVVATARMSGLAHTSVRLFQVVCVAFAKHTLKVFLRTRIVLPRKSVSCVVILLASMVRLEWMVVQPVFL